MGFSKKIKDEILVASARHCCVCHKPVGLNIEIHHIIPKEQGGEDTLDNAIALCFNCHSDAGHYFAGHPKGTKLSSAELLKHKDEWFKNVKENNTKISSEFQVELILQEENRMIFQPIFIEETTVFHSREFERETFKLLKINYLDLIEKSRTGNMVYDRYLDKIKSFDDYLDYMNGDFFPADTDDEESRHSPQPVIFHTGLLSLEGDNEHNLSVCTLNLKLKNIGNTVLEDYKIYLEFLDVVKADTVDKRTKMFDMHKYHYNTFFKDNFNAEFVPLSKTLVQNDSVELDAICFKTENIKTEVIINWSIYARGFNRTGQIKLNVEPIIEKKQRRKYVDNVDDFEPLIKIKNKYKWNE